MLHVVRNWYCVMQFVTLAVYVGTYLWNVLWDASCVQWYAAHICGVMSTSMGVVSWVCSTRSM